MVALAESNKGREAHPGHQKCQSTGITRSLKGTDLNQRSQFSSQPIHNLTWKLTNARSTYLRVCQQISHWALRGN